MDIQWYPGHMAKATRLIKEQLKNIDAVLITGDARCPQTSINTDFMPLVENKRIAFVFNKTDLADEIITEKWKAYYKKTDKIAFFTDLNKKTGLGGINAYLKEIKDTFRFNREVHVLIAGIPNVGKSMLINSLSKRSGAPTGNTPGVTRANKWVKTFGEYYLLDSPGILPPKFVTAEQGVYLASIGCVKDTIFDKAELCVQVIKFLSERYPQKLIARYKLDDLTDDAIQTIESIALKRGFVSKGGITDYERCVNIVLDEFKNGKIGTISFEEPNEFV